MIKDRANDTASATASRARAALRSLLTTFCVLGLLLALSGGARAATTLTWNGSASPNWSNAANWTPNQVPVSGDSLVFSNATAPNLNTNNDLAANTSFVTITVSVGGYTLGGNALSLITVRPVNDAPSISDIADSSVNRNSTTAAIAFTVGDAETAAANLTVTATSSDTALVPASGIVLAGSGANRTITITPAFRRTGQATITVTVSDGAATASDTFVLTVVNSNSAPTAVMEAYATTEDRALTVAAPGVLGNDTDPEGDDLSAILVTDASNGSVKLNADGSFTYTPARDFTGSDAFAYRASDGSLSSNPVAVTITVRPVNDAPIAIAQSLGTPEETPLDITFSATDVDSVVVGLAFQVIRAPEHGSLVGDGPRRRYVPSANFSGVDSFTFVASDGQATSEPATITITVGGTNDAPVAIEDVATTNEDTPIVLQVLGNDSDPENDALRIVRLAVTPASHGTIAINGNGTLRFVPERNFAGVGVFTYTITDGSLEDTTNVSVTIRPINDAPVAASQTVTVRQDSSLRIALFASDVDSSGLRFTVLRRTAHGTLSINAATNAATSGGQSLTYTPTRGFVGVDSFSFRASDGRLSSNLATITIRVLSLTQTSSTNRAPVAVADSYVARGPLQTTAATGVLHNDSDPEGNALTATLKSSPLHGGLDFRADGSFTYRPAASFSGRDSFTYAAFDGQAQSAVVTVSLQITAVPDITAPVVTIAGGAERTVLRLTPIRGSAADVYVLASGIVASSELRDVVVQLQRANGDYWNGQSYQKAPFNLPTKQVDRSFYALPESAMPPLSQSPQGRYTWTAIATDNAGNSARAVQIMVVSSTLTS